MAESSAVCRIVEAHKDMKMDMVKDIHTLPGWICSTSLEVFKALNYFEENVLGTGVLQPTSYGKKPDPIGEIVVSLPGNQFLPAFGLIGVNDDR